jgi:hypothetical protein
MFVAIGLMAAAATPALAASCRDEIGSLDARLKQEAAAASSSPTGSKDGPVAPVPTGPPDSLPDAGATARAEEAAGAGDRLVQARALLNRAHTLAQRGDDAGCLATIALGKRQLEQ